LNHLTNRNVIHLKFRKPEFVLDIMILIGGAFKTCISGTELLISTLAIYVHVPKPFI
jgi:hypothetical protein